MLESKHTNGCQFDDQQVGIVQTRFALDRSHTELGVLVEIDGKCPGKGSDRIWHLKAVEKEQTRGNTSSKGVLGD